jgi:dipeptidyl-peptidase-3
VRRFTSNADWTGHGSKSVSLGNIIDAYSQAGGKGKLQEFANDEEVVLAEKYGEIRRCTALHMKSLVMLRDKLMQA